MEKKSVIVKGTFIGIIVFIVLEVILFGYTMVIMKLVPSGTEWSLLTAVLTGSVTVLQWIVHFLSNVVWLFGASLVKNCALCASNPVIMRRIIDLLFWIGISTLVLHKREVGNG